jgi:hypothetical protein
MFIQKSVLEKYKFIQKENVWQDKESHFNQRQLVGGLSINELLTNDKKIKQLENYGIPVGLVLKKSDMVSYIHGGSLPKKIPHVVPPVIKENEESTLMKDLIQIYKNDNRNENAKTRKVKKYM